MKYRTTMGEISRHFRSDPEYPDLVVPDEEGSWEMCGSAAYEDYILWFWVSR